MNVFVIMKEHKTYESERLVSSNSYPFAVTGSKSYAEEIVKHDQDFEIEFDRNVFGNPIDIYKTDSTLQLKHKVNGIEHTNQIIWSIHRREVLEKHCRFYITQPISSIINMEGFYNEETSIKQEGESQKEKTNR